MRDDFSAQILSQEIFPYLPFSVRECLMKLSQDQLDKLEEIRLRAEKPLLCLIGDDEYGFDPDRNWTRDWQQAYRTTEEEVQRTVSAISEHSRYAFEEEIKRGFITLPGGHRVGLSGQVLCDGGQVRTLRRISGLAFRIARECKGCGDAILNEFYDPKKEILSILFVSPPRCGKTTLLRDICRQLSDGNAYAKGKPITIIDERSEIAGSFLGVPQLDVGVRTDVLDGCPKAEGMIMALRSLSPRAIITDEISRPEDARQLQECTFSGVSVITSVHASSFEEVQSRPGVCQLLQEGVFHKAIILSRRNGPGTIEKIVRCQTEWETSIL